MLRPQPKEKERRRVAIPEDLRDAMRDVYEIIGESKRDAEVCVDYDDAIQCGYLVGGRVGSRKRPFEFTYSPNGDRSTKSRWKLALHPLEIEDIADGCMKELSLYCCKSPECGHKSTDPQDLCKCDYVNDPYVGNIRLSETNEALRRIGVTEITRKSSRNEIIQILGDPHEKGGGEYDPTFGYVSPWIKYLRADCQLRFEFQKSGRLRGISILDPNWKPGA